MEHTRWKINPFRNFLRIPNGNPSPSLPNKISIHIKQKYELSQFYIRILKPVVLGVCTVDLPVNRDIHMTSHNSSKLKEITKQTTPGILRLIIKATRANFNIKNTKDWCEIIIDVPGKM